jgi:DNA polymerase-3 subunit gamma/tau
LWQLLLKGLQEVHQAPMPLEAAEMALLRVIHAAEVPDPGALLEKLANGEAVSVPGGAGAPAAAPAAAVQAAAPQAPADFPALVERLESGGKHALAQQLHDYCGLVRYEPPELVVRPAKPLSGDFTRDLAAALKGMTGSAWQVRASDEPARPTLLEQEKTAKDALRQSVLDAPLVRAALEAFPGAELAGYSIDEQRSA